MIQLTPCLKFGCHICCLDTRMTLTEADVARLEAAYGTDRMEQLLDLLDSLRAVAVQSPGVDAWLLCAAVHACDSALCRKRIPTEPAESAAR